ncbi:methyltransferase domain-containing protein [Photobacterium angustum]|nr:methyltransferase domain-containing protein [Photobacterium angustum]
MKPARTVTHIEVPYSWSNVTNGEWAAQLLQARIDEWCPKLFGYHMLKLGGLSAELTSHHCNIQHQISVDKFSSYRNVEAESFELPFVEKSFDACLLIHQLDYSTDPHRLLREVDRVTVDDGYLLLSGNNPLSVNGFCGLLPWNRNKAPWNGRMYLSSRVIDWLRLLNYEVIYHETFAVLPSTRHLTCSAWLENILSEPLSAVGSLYFIVARKRTFPLKPIEPKWKVRRQLAPLQVNCRTEACDKMAKRDAAYKKSN